ncbi:MAG: hypothetical protein WBO46_17895 [Caldilineaceae bacterium]
MLYLTIGSASQLNVTLYENCTNTTNPYFAWSITDCDTNVSYVFTNQDNSPAPEYFNRFTFSVVTGATYGLTAGIIPCSSGQFVYNIYEMTTQYDLDISNAVPNINSADGIVETGILNVIGTYSQNIITFTQSQNIIVFRNN